MLKKIITLVSLSLATMAQAVDFNVTFPAGGQYEQMRLYVRPMGDHSPQSATELIHNDSLIFTGKVVNDSLGLYMLYAADDKAQYTLPIYVKSGDGSVTLEMTIDGYETKTNLNDPANRALHDYAALTTEKTIDLNKNFDSKSNEEVRRLMLSIVSDADSIAGIPGLTSDIAEYIRMWGYVSANDAVSMLPYLTRKNQRNLGFEQSELFPDPVKRLDSPMALYFPSSFQTIVKTIEGDTLEEKMASLYGLYKTPAIRRQASDIMVSSFLNNFNYNDGFENGLERLIAVVGKYDLPSSYVDTFKARRATIIGAPFPEGVTLVDRDGNRVDFSKFRGKYVYVDLWASWCGPCCREVPFLQKLEKELEGSDIAFVSISIDSSREPWIKKMEQLDMHGNQLWNSDENLPKLLNVRGIPHFLIYDKEGKLHTYKAMRPSNTHLLEMLRSL